MWEMESVQRRKMRRERENNVTERQRCMVSGNHVKQKWNVPGTITESKMNQNRTRKWNEPKIAELCKMQKRGVIKPENEKMKTNDEKMAEEKKKDPKTWTEEMSKEE